MIVSLAEHEPARPSSALHHPASLLCRYQAVRGETERLAAVLTPEDQCVQSMADASPAKWHRAHTTWFFETFVLREHVPGYRVFDPAYSFLFNSYYEAIGQRQARDRRAREKGIEFITKDEHLRENKEAAEAVAYRKHVDSGGDRALDKPPAPTDGFKPKPDWAKALGV